MGPLPATPSAPAARSSLLRPVLSAGAAFTLLSATGAPTAKTVTRLTDAGLSADQAAIALHAAPVIIAMVGLALGLIAVRESDHGDDHGGRVQGDRGLVRGKARIGEPGH
ncbi:MAG: hypothetical protein SGJ23_05805, partial [Alphaproteobacteria bacterium]|nr:hypothetical protein [Alphaproteobacteria bacterium]